MSAPTIQHKALKKPQANLARLEGDLTAASRAVERGGAELRAAKEADDEARADAKAREATPPAPKAKAVAEHLEAAEQERADTRRAVEKVQAELDQAIKTHRPEIEQQIKAALAKVREGYSHALEELAERHRQMAAHEAELGWLRDGKWTPNAMHTVPLDTTSGSDIPRDMPKELPIEMVLEGLRVRGLPPKQKVVGPPAPPLGQSLIGRGVHAGSPMFETLI